MEKQLCVNGTLDDAKFAAPMPVIGVYIAGGTLVCFLFMISDILHGFWRRKPWLPCHLFSLNSLTLTLLSIATKLPVDLTTSMPSALDQLSKLTGTALICISMGFFMPSIGIMSHKEGFGNMASLTILVVAVVVNVSIQMATGVIFSFIVEHIIILFCMLELLVVLWYSMSSINLEKATFTDRNRELLLKGTARRWSSESSMLQRLRTCYVHSYSSNPQFVFFQTSNCVVVGMLCTVCSVVLSEAVLRSLAIKELKFCKGVSDYGWSTKVVVVTQILTVLAGSLATGLRWLTFVNLIDSWKFAELNSVFARPLFYEGSTVKRLFFAIRFSNTSCMKISRFLEALVKFVDILILYVLCSQIVQVSSLMLTEFFTWAMGKIKTCYGFFINKDIDGGAVDSMSTEELQMTEEFHNVVYSVNERLKNWSLRISVKDMERWMKINEKRDLPNNLIQLLLKIPPSQQSLANNIQGMGESYPLDNVTNIIFGHHYNYRVSCLSILVLVLVATISLPATLSGSLIQTLDEVFEIIYFIDKKMNAMNLMNEITWMLTKDLWRDRDIMNCRFEKKKIMGRTDLECAFEIIDKLRNYKFVLLDPEVKIVTNFIKNQEYTSVDELYNHIEQLLVDMLHLHLRDFPCAIFKDIVESPAKDCEERVRRAMKFVCKLEPLNDIFHWSFPDGSTHLPTTDTHGNQCGRDQDGSSGNSDSKTSVNQSVEGSTSKELHKIFVSALSNPTTAPSAFLAEYAKHYALLATCQLGEEKFSLKDADYAGIIIPAMLRLMSEQDPALVQIGEFARNGCVRLKEALEMMDDSKKLMEQSLAKAKEWQRKSSGQSDPS